MGDGEEDLISALHDDLLGKIISRLPVKEAHLRGPTRAAAVSRVLADHPGPFRTVLLHHCRFAPLSPELAEWPRLLAAKAVQTLAFVNQKPTEAQAQPCLPADIFRCASLKQLFLACWAWTLPDHLSRSLVVFPHLQRLTVANIAMSGQDLNCLLAASPVLETLVLACPIKCFNVRSKSLRSVVVFMVGDFAVVEAPLLDRLIVLRPLRYVRADPMRVEIASSSNLRVLGYINPMFHKLQINDNIIKPDTMASPSTVVPGIKILALKVNFCVLEGVKMVPSLLRCFPNVYTLHIESVMDDPSETGYEPTGEHHAKFWQDASPVECLRSHVKRMVFHKFRGHQNEFEFLKFVARDAKALRSLLLVPSKEKVLSADEVNKMIENLGCPSFRAWTSKVLLVSPEVENDWPPMKACDITVDDPFC